MCIGARASIFYRYALMVRYALIVTNMPDDMTRYELISKEGEKEVENGGEPSIFPGAELVFALQELATY